MTKKIRSFSVVVYLIGSLCMFQSSANALTAARIDGYLNAKFGMSYDQVVKIIKDRNRNIAEEKFVRGGGLKITVTEGLLGTFQVTEDFGVPAPRAKVDYWFTPSTKKLYIVEISCDGNYYTASRKVLIKKYGEPFRSAEESVGQTKTLRDTWVYPDNPSPMIILNGIEDEKDVIIATSVFYCPPKELFIEGKSEIGEFKDW